VSRRPVLSTQSSLTSLSICPNWTEFRFGSTGPIKFGSRIHNMIDGRSVKFKSVFRIRDVLIQIRIRIGTKGSGMPKNLRIRNTVSDYYFFYIIRQKNSHPDTK
jgi:hypothetical protein